ncbi:hypothetical protein CONPUDRAFT_143692 [Coniophora puteana RWD-64-598 SS2]|uniref:CLASP N-terminal domain-containing protein n=1 Tax=Coniophora puteana (strain RWD-64-598) TaxID=741705 RepID=A0A5M3MT68_CONPW|nr:uncharacterized protein CONPUDRAFT_143692 [Coniophora puteana RWD-64-598 SS2]EIW82237.1 hypothetical protein CONPUDRAFT_143692 [Coniophora puteana RWD-64-598 SS2]
MSTERLEKLVNQCKSNDVDSKIDAVNKLQAEFETGLEIVDAEPLVAALKSCLRVANQHLTTATLSALPPFLPLIISRHGPSAPARSTSMSTSTSSSSNSSIDLNNLRLAMSAFLPAPGIIERLGDNREKARDRAREALVLIGGFAFRSGTPSSKLNQSRGQEPPLAVFERYMRESGLGSKVWRVREQSLLTLVHIRRSHHLFPLKPYMTMLVEMLEDTDGNVRAIASPSVIELFTGPGVSDAARADLKKEMTKKNVRKGIMDNILSKLVSGRGNGARTPDSSESGDAGAKKEYVPPSLLLAGRKPTSSSTTSTTQPPSSMSRVTSHGRPPSRAAAVVSPPPPPVGTPTEGSSTVEPVYITSSRDLENEFSSMIKPFEGKETEHNWAARERAIMRVRGMLKGDLHNRYHDIFIACLREPFIQNSFKTSNSLRTTVAANTCSLYSELAVALGTALDPFCESLYSNLLRMAGFTKKIIAQQSQATVITILKNTSSQPRTLLPLLWNHLQEKTVQTRAYMVSHISDYIQTHGFRAKAYIESSGGLEILEKSIKKALNDPNPAVRETARVVFWSFENVWREPGMIIMDTLDATARKQLQKACPDPSAVPDLPTETPKVAKKSVAAAIAATRAKQRANANAPPTLRHQATSTSYAAARAASPPAKRIVSSPLDPSSSTNGHNALASSHPTLSSRPSLSPPISPRSRMMTTGAMPRSVSTGAVTTSYSRSPSESPTSDLPQGIKRRPSSPLSRPPAQRGPSANMDTFRPSKSNAVPVLARASNLFPDFDDDEELLLATTVPVPDSDSDADDHNLMSFSTPYKLYPPKQQNAEPRSKRPSFSPRSDDSRQTASNALSNGSQGKSDIAVEDALRARAEQAESTAERLLEELSDPEKDSGNHPTIPSSLLLGSTHQTPKAAKNAGSVFRSLGPPPVTPVNRNASIFRQAAAFQNSPAAPANNGADSLLKPLQDQSHMSSWWLKRTSAIDTGTPLKAVNVPDRAAELEEYISLLEDGDNSVRVLQKLAQLCSNNPLSPDITSPLSPGLGLPNTTSPFLSTLPKRDVGPIIPNLWTKDKKFGRLFGALLKVLDPSKSAETLEYALIVLWEILTNQGSFLDGQEADMFTAIFQVRYSNQLNVLEATKTIRDGLCARAEPVYGLTLLHGSLRTFMAEPSADVSSRDATHAFGLIALAKFIMRLPLEILEDELPRLKTTLLSALNESAPVVREAASTAIIAAQMVLRDETHLFALLDGLSEYQKNLLTYYFEKHGARAVDVNANAAGMTKLEGQMGRLDKLMNTPHKTRPTDA